MESVWDYPRPPRVEQATRRVRVVHAGVVVADTDRAWRVLETSHPPVYYVDRAEIRPDSLVAVPDRSFCEFKGYAGYFDLVIGDARSSHAAWSYEHPSPGFEVLAGAVAFYPGRVAECWVGDERVRPQEGDFYGVWITDDIAGPFKGTPGTAGW